MPPRLKYDLHTDKQLPPCEGPKLHAFKDRHRPVKFVKLISQPDSESDTSGGHAHVFEVRINGSPYALKVFKFYNLVQERELLYPPWNRQVSDDILTYHSDPFFAECRAYGRMIETQTQSAGKSKRKNNPIAVPCYGYMGLSTAKYEAVMGNKFGIKHWGRTSEGQSAKNVQKQPFRALVKQLIDSEKNLGTPSRMLKDLRGLLDMGIYPRDVCARNYKGGLLVDFSSAWTKPFWLFTVLRPGELEMKLTADEEDFDAMIESEGIAFPMARATRNESYCKCLRSNPFEE